MNKPNKIKKTIFARATALKHGLIVALIIGFIGAFIAFYFIYQDFNNYAIKISDLTSKASAGDSNLKTIKALSSYLSQNQSIVKKADNLTANSNNYNYQEQIINDLNNYANMTGVSISKIDFTNATNSTSSSSTSSSISSTQSNQKNINVTVALNTPLVYTNYLKFVQATEKNNTAMQLQGISLTRDSTSNLEVSTQPLVFKVYLK